MNNGLASEEPEPAVEARRGGLLITLRGTTGTWRQHVVGPFARIGSDPRCEVVLPSGPRVRLFIQATPRGLYCLGFAVRRATPVASGWLRDGRWLDLDRWHQFSARWTGPPPDRDADAARHQSIAAEPLELEIASLLDAFRAIRFRPRRRLTVVSRQTLIWSSPSSRAAIVEPHCVLYWDDRQLLAIDLFGGSGLRVEGRSVDSTPVVAGRPVVVGSYCIRRLVPPARAAAASSIDVVNRSASSPSLAGSRHPPGALAYLQDQTRFTPGEISMPRKVDISNLLTPASPVSSHQGANGSATTKTTPNGSGDETIAARHEGTNGRNAHEQVASSQDGAPPLPSQPLDEDWLFDRLLEQQTRATFERRYRRMTIALAVGGSAVAVGTAALAHAVQQYDLAQWLRLTNG